MPIVHGAMHIGRSWSGHILEDACPCVQEPCGLVLADDAHDLCHEHPESRTKTIRQMHAAELCPALPAGDAWGRAEYERYRTDLGAPHWRLLSAEDKGSWRAQAARSQGDRLQIMNGWLVRTGGDCCCAAPAGEAHGPHCGTEPLMGVEELALDLLRLGVGRRAKSYQPSVPRGGTS